MMLQRPLHELEREIRACELRVVECDQRLHARLHALRGTASRAIGTKLLTGGALVAAGWLLRRPARRAAAAPRAARHGIASLLVGAQRWLPVLLPLAAPLLNRKVAMLLAGLGLPVAAREVAPLRTVPSLDLQAFSGRWFEIARLQGPRDKPGRHDATLHYNLDEEGMAVAQRWTDEQGQPHEKLGRLRGTARQHAGELEVSYAPAWLRWWPGAWDDHWVLYADRGYTCALIGSPERDSLLVLSRDPVMPDDAVQALYALADKLGFDSARLRRTPHA